MNRYSISPAQPADHDAVLFLLLAQMLEHHIPTGTERLSRVIKHVLAHQECGFFLVARTSHEVAGVAYVASLLSAEHGGFTCWLEELHVTTAHRNQGAGTMLLEAAIEHACARGYAAMDLDVDIEHRRVESLYRRYEFRNLPRARWVRTLNEAG